VGALQALDQRSKTFVLVAQVIEGSRAPRPAARRFEREPRAMNHIIAPMPTGQANAHRARNGLAEATIALAMHTS
jgi:hypothetical protein